MPERDPFLCPSRVSKGCKFENRPLEPCQQSSSRSRITVCRCCLPRQNAKFLQTAFHAAAARHALSLPAAAAGLETSTVVCVCVFPPTPPPPSRPRSPSLLARHTHERTSGLSSISHSRDDASGAKMSEFGGGGGVIMKK